MRFLRIREICLTKGWRVLHRERAALRHGEPLPGDRAAVPEALRHVLGAQELVKEPVEP